MVRQTKPPPMAAIWTGAREQPGVVQPKPQVASERWRPNVTISFRCDAPDAPDLQSGDRRSHESRRRSQGGDGRPGTGNVPVGLVVNRVGCADIRRRNPNTGRQISSCGDNARNLRSSNLQSAAACQGSPRRTTQEHRLYFRIFRLCGRAGDPKESP